MTEGQIIEADHLLRSNNRAERVTVAGSGMIGLAIGAVAIVLGPASAAVTATGVTVAVLSSFIQRMVM